MTNKLIQIDARIEKLKAQRAAALARVSERERKKILREAIQIGTWFQKNFPDQCQQILAKVNATSAPPASP